MCPTPDSTLADPDQINADLQRQLAECRAERDEALARETATAEVLQVINSSPGDLAPVFDAMLEKAIYLCQASFGTLWTYDGEGIQAAAVRDAPREYIEFVKQRRFPVNAVVQRLLHGDQAVQIGDLMAAEGYGLGDPSARELVQRARNRTLLAVALRKEGRCGIVFVDSLSSGIEIVGFSG